MEKLTNPWRRDPDEVPVGKKLMGTYYKPIPCSIEVWRRKGGWWANAEGGEVPAPDKWQYWPAIPEP
jgi:hypothetical protein